MHVDRSRRFCEKDPFFLFFVILFFSYTLHMDSDGPLDYGPYKMANGKNTNITKKQRFALILHTHTTGEATHRSNLTSQVLFLPCHTRGGSEVRSGMSSSSVRPFSYIMIREGEWIEGGKVEGGFGGTHTPITNQQSRWKEGLNLH